MEAEARERAARCGLQQAAGRLAQRRSFPPVSAPA
jgi:hypothetical protein